MSGISVYGSSQSYVQHMLTAMSCSPCSTSVLWWEIPFHPILPKTHFPFPFSGVPVLRSAVLTTTKRRTISDDRPLTAPSFS